MKFKEFKHEPVKPDTYEASMAMNQLHKIGRHAIKLHNMIDDRAEMESWVAKKIDLAGDYVKKVHGYMMGVKAGYYEAHGGEHTTSGRSMTKGEMSKREKIVKGMKKDKAGFKKRYGKDAEAVMYATATKQAMGEDAPFGSGMDLVRMAVMRKFISAEEYMNYAKELKAAGEEVEEKYADWPEGEGFGSSDGNFAIKDMMSAAGYEFDEQDRGGRFIVTKMPEKLEKMGIKNARMRDAVTTEDAGEKIANMAQNMTRDEFISNADELGLTPEEAAEYYKKMQGGAYASKFEDKGSTLASRTISRYADEIGPDSMDYDMFKKTAELLDAGKLKSLARHIYYSDTSPAEYVMKVISKKDPETFKKMYGDQDGYFSLMKPRKDLTDDESVSEDAGEGHMSKSTLYHTAKYAIELLGMIQKGDDLEGWVQSKLNKAADYLQGVYNYEEYQKLNPYREELDSSILQRHAGIVQKNIDEILSKETDLDDIDTKPGMMRILKKRVNEVEKQIAKETRKKTDESGIMYRAGVKKYGKKGMTAIQSAAGKGASHQEIGKIKDKYLKDAELDEGLKDWAKNLAMAGIFVAGLTGMGAIQDAIDNSVPAVKAMNTAYEMAVDAGNDELADMIKNDISAVKVRLESGRDLNFVKSMQDKYIKFMPTEGIAYESKLALLLNQRLK